MKIYLNITGKVDSSEDELRVYAMHKLYAALKSKKNQVKEVILNINNNTDTCHRCAVRLYIPGQYPIQVVKRANNIFSAINSAISTISHKTDVRTRQRMALFFN